MRLVVGRFLYQINGIIEIWKEEGIKSKRVIYLSNRDLEFLMRKCFQPDNIDIYV